MAETEQTLHFTAPTLQSSSPRIRREQKTVRAMLALYCRDHHSAEMRGTDRDLCPACQALFDYSQARVKNCRFGAEKPTCVNCPVHCFKPDKRESIREVMRYAGPRMMFNHPVLTVYHLLDKKKPAPQIKRSRRSGAVVDS